jgi:general secretion pathway protein D
LYKNFYIAVSLTLLFGVSFAEEAGEVDKLLQRESILVGERRAQAEQSFQEGLALYRQQDFQSAVRLFKKTLELDPQHPEAKTYLIRVQSVMGLETDGLQAKSSLVQDRIKVKRMEQNLDLSFKLDQADLAYESLKSKTYSDAGVQLKDMEGVLSMYENALALTEGLHSRNDREKMGESIKIRIGELKEDITDIKSRIQAKIREDAQERMQRERVENEQYLVNRIQNILDAAEESLAREDFDGAVRLAEDVLTVEPENKRAKSIKNRSLKARHVRVDEEIIFERNKELTRSILKIKDAFIPYSSGVVYPDDWDKIKERQEESIGASKDAPAWEQRLERSLDRHTNYSCPAGTPLQEVLSQLSDISGLNIVLNPKVLQEQDEADLEIRNEIKYEGLPLRYILNWVVREVGLTYTLKFDVIFVTTKKTQADRLMLQIYDIQDLLASKQSFTPPSLEDGFVAGDDEGGLEIDLGDDDFGGEAISSDVIVQMLQDSISGDWDDPDGVGILLRALETGGLLVKNTPRVHQEIIELLRELRKTSALQVEVEARSLTVSKNFFREVGIDWTGLDTTAPLDAGVSTGFFDNSGDDYSYKGAIVNGLTSNLSNTLGFFVEHSILGSLQAKILLRAIEQDTDTTTLISPRIVLVNNILGYIRLGETQNYIAGYEIGEEDGAGIQPEVETLDEGQLLAVTATISSDRKYITVRIHPDFQTVTIPRTVTLSGTDTATTLAGATVVQYNLPIDLPVVTKQRIRTTAVIPDRGVLIMGGISESSEEDSTRGVPVLSKVPFLGRLFRSDSKSDSSNDTMFLLHGKIIIFDELEAGL